MSILRGNTTKKETKPGWYLPCELQTEQDKRNLPETWLHPVPRPGSNLQKSLQVLWIRDVRGDKEFIEVMYGWLVEDQREGSSSSRQSCPYPDLIGKRHKEQILIVIMGNLVKSLTGFIVAHVIDSLRRIVLCFALHKAVTFWWVHISNAAAQASMVPQFKIGFFRRRKI